MILLVLVEASECRRHRRITTDLVSRFMWLGALAKYDLQETSLSDDPVNSRYSTSDSIGSVGPEFRSKTDRQRTQYARHYLLQ